MQTVEKSYPKKTIEIGSDEWHEDRRQGIGGSDCAAALGLSKWKTPYDLYLEKIGESTPQEETWEMERGKAMEPLLRQHYADTTGREVLLPRGAIVHPKYPFMRYNPDGLTPDRLQEFKTAAFGREWGEVGTDEIPQEYILQVQHGMIVTQRLITDVTVSIMGAKPRYFMVQADRELQEMIIEHEAEFWRKVNMKEAPEPVSNEDVAKMYSHVNGLSIIITPQIAAAVSDLRSLRQGIKDAEIRKEELEVQIKNFMGENELLCDEFYTPIITWKQAKGAERLDTKALKENEPGIYETYLKTGDPTRRFLVK